MLHLGRGVPRVARDDDRPRPERSVEGDDELRRVREDHRDAVALLDAETTQPIRETPGRVGDALVRALAVEEDRRRRLRVACGGIVEHRLQWDPRIDARRRHAWLVMA